MHPMELLLRTTLNAGAVLAPRPAGRAAFALFIRPLGRPRLRSGEADVMGRARRGHIDVDGISVATYQWGDGPRPVLVVHGWSSRASRLSGFVQALLDRGHSVVSFDAPGHGESAGRATNIRQIRAAIRLLHAEHGEFGAVVAHSLGVLGTFFALRDGERGGVRDGVRADRIVALGGIAQFDYLMEQFSARLGLSRRVRAALRDHIESRVFGDEPGVWPRLDAVYRPEQVGADILLVHDADDDVSAPGQSRVIAAAYGERARLVETRGLGHRRILGDPEVIALAAEFVTTGSAGGSAAEGSAVVPAA